VGDVMGEAFRKAGVKTMGKKCKVCGKQIDDKFEYCFDHKDTPRNQGGRMRDSAPPSVKDGGRLDSYYDEGNHLRREVFDDVPRFLAERFERDDVKINAVRRFYECVCAIKEDLVKGKEFEQCRSELFALLPKAEYQRNRGIVSDEFVRFGNIDVFCSANGYCF